MQLTNSLVSIIVRTKDRPKLLRRALASIATQTYRPLEVVLVNDGGCDLPASELNEVLKDVHLNSVRLEESKGRAFAGNIGIENSRGEYIGFLDDDDELYPDHLITHMSFHKHSGYMVSYTDALMVRKMYDSESCEFKEINKEPVFGLDFNFDLLVFENYIPIMCLLFSREVFNKAGLFDNDLELYEDWDLLIRIGSLYPFAHINKTTAIYNQWSEDLQIAQNNKDADFLKRSYLKVLSKHKDLISFERIHAYMQENVRDRFLLKDKTKLELRMREVETLLSDKESRIREVETLLRDKELRIRELEDNLTERDRLIATIFNGRGWKLLERYRKIKNRINENLFFKGLMILKDQGIRSLIHKVNKKLLFSRKINDNDLITPSHIKIISISEPDLMPVEGKVSVIIPTKNAGYEFEYILRRITQQEGVKDKEIIIIDSGSTDMTIDICKNYTEHIFHLPPESFHHARTRNIAGEKATGEYLVFIVQDAIPIGNYWLNKLLSPIQAGKATAASTNQIPRADADFYACWSYKSHYIEYLKRDRDNIFSSQSLNDPERLDKSALIKMGSLDNVSLGIKKSVFDKYHFNSAYAEDLELGLKLLNDGHKIMIQASNAMIHSHNRPSVYFFKRNYVDTYFLSRILGLDRKNIPPEIIMESISHIYTGLKASLSFTIDQSSHFAGPISFIDLLISKTEDYVIFSDNAHIVPGDPGLDDLFASINPTNHPEIVSGIYSVFRANLLNFSKFMENYNTIEGREEDFYHSIYKVFCCSSGHYLGANTKERLKFLSGGI